jgi:hypothetical protein
MNELNDIEKNRYETLISEVKKEGEMVYLDNNNMY